MQKLRPILLTALLLGMLALGWWLGVFVPRLLGFLPATKVYNTAAVLRQVQTLSQLVTVKYVLEKVVVLEDAKWYPGGESRVLLLAHGVVKAGVDLNQLGVEDVRVSGKKITLRLPQPQLLDCYLDDQQTRVIERSTGLLRLFDKDLEQIARQRAVDDIRRGARSAGILKDADERARAQLTSLFHQMGFDEVEVLSR